MQPCDELKNIVLQHYNKFHTGEQAHSIEDTYSRQEGVVIISNDPNEWFDDRCSIDVFIKAGGSSQLDIEVQNLVAYCEGSVGWTADRVTVKLPNGVGIPVRHTRIFHQEDGAWKLVHLHTCIAVLNERIGK
ncbi:MAG TPA: nuclear transport factor 2 family protein [Anaerolineales bacterium]|nr:nuclear transport factor 2 family protein [Anaerolineales bacterium]